MSIGVKAARTWDEWEGQIVDGKYQLIRYLGGSSGGAVFLTERPGAEPGRAAIKLVPADNIRADAQLARWQASALLSHPHLVRLFETGRAGFDGTSFAYVVMEYAEEDLSQVPRPLTKEEAADMLGSALKALAYLHGKGLAHGHLKPSNIMAVSDQLKLSSDTIRSTGEWSSVLDSRQPSDPPEFVNQGASAAGDVWSLGVTLVEALTRHLPTLEAGAAVASLPEGLPGEFRTSVSNCLRQDPRQRWTVADFAKSLLPKVEAPEPPLPPPSKAPVAETKKSKLRYLVPVGVIALALAGVEMVRVADHPAATVPPVVEPVVAAREPVVSPPPAEEPPPKAAVPEPATKEAVPEPAKQTAGPEIVKQVLPDVPAKARNTIQGKVAVTIRVGVDRTGSVVEAKSESPDTSRFFSNLALHAARQWKFAPANSDRSDRSREWSLHFRFFADPERPVSVQAIPAR